MSASAPPFRPSGRHLALVGPTASGKSSLALDLARSRTDLEIVTVDSMQVYRGMDIGTAKPSGAEQSEIRHHLIDIVDADDDYTVSRFQADCRVALESIESRGNRAILVGGTGLYFQAITDDLEIPGQFPEVRAELEEDPDTVGLHRRLEELDPVAAARMDSANRRRVIRALEVVLGSGRPFSSFGPGIDAYPTAPFPIVGLDMPRDILGQRIAERYDEQFIAGFVDEVRVLLDRPGGLSRTARQALGYRELIDHFENGTPLEEAKTNAVVRTRRFARRQLRWFGRDPRIGWMPTDGTNTEIALAAMTELLGD